MPIPYIQMADDILGIGGFQALHVLRYILFNEIKHTSQRWPWCI